MKYATGLFFLFALFCIATVRAQDDEDLIHPVDVEEQEATPAVVDVVPTEAADSDSDDSDSDATEEEEGIDAQAADNVVTVPTEDTTEAAEEGANEAANVVPVTTAAAAEATPPAKITMAAAVIASEKPTMAAEVSTAAIPDAEVAGTADAGEPEGGGGAEAEPVQSTETKETPKGSSEGAASVNILLLTACTTLVLKLRL